MGTKRSIPLIVLLLLLVLQHAECLRLGQWVTTISLCRSLMIRVANARAARGDLAGADRARKIAGGRLIWSGGWDFATKHAFGSPVPSAETYRSASEIAALLGEFYGLGSAEERADWMLREYPRLMDRSKSLFRILLRSLARSGGLREVVLAVQEEVLEAGLLRDCLEVGAADLEGLLRVAKDMMSSSSSSSYSEL